MNSGTSRQDTSLLFRDCRAADLDAVQALVDDLYISDPNTPDTRPDITLTFNELERRPDKGRLIVLESDSSVIGYCIIIFFWSNEYGGNIIDVDELCLAGARRGEGIGAKLFDWLEKEYSDNLVGFSFQVAHFNEPMLKLARKLGFEVARNQHLIKVFAEQ